MDQDLIRQIRQNRHVFVFSVCGRASSTALQRILNSSGEICLWGEPWVILEAFRHYLFVDNLLDNEVVKLQKDGLAMLQASLEDGQHTRFYANAFPDWKPYRDHLADLVTGQLLPPGGEVSPETKFGFKEIKGESVQHLRGIRRMFPNSRFIFLFRDPREQWVSVKKLKYHHYARRVMDFAAAYHKQCRIYEQFRREDENCLLIQNTALFDEQKAAAIIRWAGLTKFDQSLVGKQVHTAGKMGGRRLKLEQLRLRFTPAWKSFRQMELEADFK